MSIKTEGLIIGLIPARGGSKGIPDKNIRLLGGKPLIAYTIECGRNCPSIDHLVLSTDSGRIADIGRRYGAAVPFVRPGELAKDDTPMLPVMQHAITACEKEYGKRVIALVLLDPTSPFREPADIEGALKFFLEDDACDAVVSGCPSHKSPYFNMVRPENGYVRLLIEPAQAIGSRQQCPLTYDLDTTVWIYSREALMDKKQRLPKKTKIFLIPEERAFHIDSEWDIKMAELFLERKGALPL